MGIPPGMAEDEGILYDIDDHADMTIFRRQILDFRRWMAEQGFRDRPLVVSEYGILMPESYGSSAGRGRRVHGRHLRLLPHGCRC